MSPLLSFLSSWNGRRSVQDEISRRGFTAYFYYQDEIRRYCRSHGLRNDVDTYWDEVALEWVMSAGRAASDQRQFRGATAYRSDYLDNLHKELDATVYSFRFPSLHPYLNERRMEDENGHLEISKQLSSKIHNYKTSEIQEFDNKLADWGGTRAELNMKLGEALKPLGYSIVSSREWNDGVLPQGLQKIDRELVVQCGIILGNPKMLPSTVDIRVRLFMKDAPNEIFREGNFSKVIPGFGYYRGFLSTGAALVGINAYAHCIDVFTRSFSRT